MASYVNVEPCLQLLTLVWRHLSPYWHSSLGTSCVPGTMAARDRTPCLIRDFVSLPWASSHMNSMHPIQDIAWAAVTHCIPAKVLRTLPWKQPPCNLHSWLLLTISPWTSITDFISLCSAETSFWHFHALNREHPNQLPRVFLTVLALSFYFECENRMPWQNSSTSQAQVCSLPP